MNTRTTVVFGGSSGIGKAIAERCAQDGDAVVLVARNADKLARAAEDVERAGAASVRWLTTDLSHGAMVDATLTELATIAPAPNRLVLNGGGPPFGTFTDISLQQWQSSVDEILLSQVRILRALVPRLSSGSAVVAVLSDVVRSAGADRVLPCSLRLALVGVIKCLAMQYAGQGIRFNAISPGPTDTDRARNLLQRAAQTQGISEDAARARLASGLPAGRLAAPAEIASVAHFLLSDAASYVSGANYLCDGALTVVPL